MKTIKAKLPTREIAAVEDKLKELSSVITGVDAPMSLSAGFSSSSELLRAMTGLGVQNGYLRLGGVPLSYFIDTINDFDLFSFSAIPSINRIQRIEIRRGWEMPVVGPRNSDEWFYEISIDASADDIEECVAIMDYEKLPVIKLNGKPFHRMSPFGNSVVRHIVRVVPEIDKINLFDLIRKSMCSEVTESVLRVRGENLRNLECLDKYLLSRAGGFRNPAWIGLEHLGFYEDNIGEVKLSDISSYVKGDWSLSKYYLVFPLSSNKFTRSLRGNSLSVVHMDDYLIEISIDRFDSFDPTESFIAKQLKEALISKTQLKWR